MFNLYVGELRKTAKPKTLLGMGIALIVLLVVMAIAFNAIKDMATQFAGGSVSYAETEDAADGGETTATAGYYVSLEDLNRYIAIQQEQYDELTQAYKSDTKYYSEMKKAKAALVLLQYAKNNGYYDKDVKLLGINYSLSGMDGETFMNFYIKVVMLVLLIFGAVIGANAYVNEYKSGTIKLVMTRPITKNQMTLAKLLALYTVEGVLFLASALIAYAYGAVAFGTNSAEKFLYGFDYIGGGISTVGAFTFATVVMSLVQMLVLSTVSFCLGTVTRKPVWGILTVLVIVLGLGAFLSYLKMEAFLLSNAFDLMNFFDVSASIPEYGNFFISLAVLVFWTAASVASVFTVVNKRDII